MKSMRTPSLLAASMAIVAMSLGGFVPSASAQSAGASSTLTPSVISVDDASQPEIPNAMRGQYRWGGYAAKPDGWPSTDEFESDRIYWGRVEPTKGAYNFAGMDGTLASAASTGGKAGLRVEGYCPGCWMNLRSDTTIWPGWGPVTPSWMPLQPGTDIPDWNSEGFLSAYEQLMKAMGDRYRDDPRLGYVDLGGYSAYGEGQDAGAGPTPITVANYQRMVKAAATNFPNKWVLVNTISMPEKFKPALAAYSNVGMRSDNLGCGVHGNNWDMYSWVYPDVSLQDYWKTRPFVSMTCNQAQASGALAGVQNYHLSSIGSNVNATTAADPQWQLAAKKSGFRYAVSKLVATQGSTSTVFDVTINNAGVAPTYDDWNVVLTLTPTGALAGQPVITMTLPTRLKGVLPGDSTFSVSISSALTAGDYAVSIKAVDPVAYLAPMGLANTGRAADGSYPLGTITITSDPVDQTMTAGSVSIAGNAVVGFTLSASSTAWMPSDATLSYQWLRNGVAIAGATSSTYAPVAADAGASLTVTVTGTKAGYTSTSTTSAAVSVKAGTITSGSVSITGTAAVGSTLTANPVGYSPSDATLRYQWQRNGANIAGATSKTYALVRADFNKDVRVVVTLSKPGYGSVSVASGAVRVKAGPTSSKQKALLSDSTKDGIADAYAIDTAGALRFRAGTAAGPLGAPRVVGSGWAGFRLALSPGDLNSDGTPDIWAITSAGQVRVYRASAAQAISFVGSFGSGWQNMRLMSPAGDVNADGVPDVYAVNSSGELWIYRIKPGGVGVLSSSKLTSGWGGYTAIMGGADLDGDGWLDIIARDAAGSLRFFPGASTGTGAPTGTGTVIGSGWSSLSALSLKVDARGARILAKTSAGSLLSYPLVPGYPAPSFAAKSTAGTGFGTVTKVF